MSHYDDLDDSTLQTSSQGRFPNLLSLPHELLQSILASIANFEPLTYSSPSERADAIITDNELKLYTRDAMPFNLTSSNRLILGLSSMDDWLVSLLSRHPYHLTCNGKGGISSAVTQALRRESTRRERSYRTKQGSRPMSQVPADIDRHSSPQVVGTKHSSANDETLDQQSSAQPTMIQYHARVEAEEVPATSERSKSQLSRVCQALDIASSPTTALVLYNPAPVLKLTQQELSQLAAQSEQLAVSKNTALLALVLIIILQCHLSLKENLEKLKRDTPIPPIEADESEEFATRKMSPRSDRPRSLSGSTIADLQPHEETLSFSMISTVYSSHSGLKEGKEVRWAEKRVGEENEMRVPPKRPKLSEFKQVSSGRVATLMDRFEKFHL